MRSLRIGLFFCSLISVSIGAAPNSQAQYSFERIFENNNHWRNVFPPPRCTDPVYFVLRTAPRKTPCSTHFT